MQIVIATSNLGKLREFRALVPPRFSLAGLDAHPQVVLPEETGTSYEENAVLKAEAAAAQTGLPALGDDSGLEVAVLGNRPGLYSARYCPKEERKPGESQDEANRRKLLEDLSASKRPQSEWAAKFVCALAYAVPGQKTQLFRGEAEGQVLSSPRGTNGFGYDPLLFVAEFEMTFAELEDDVKNRNSHRGRAVEAWLRTMSA
jgi:XTP/dITP diphosphohydrolase